MLTTKTRRLNRVREGAVSHLTREMEAMIMEFRPIAQRIFIPAEIQILAGSWRNPPGEFVARIEADPEARAVWQRCKEIERMALLIDGLTR